MFCSKPQDFTLYRAETLLLNSIATLHSTAFGSPDKPALIFIHGLFGSGRIWRSLAKRLENDFWVHTPDLRNHGNSPFTDSMSFEEMAHDIRAYMDAQHIETASFMGHSLGGKVAMQFALLWPERTIKLMVEDIAPVAYRPRHEAVFKAARAMRKKVLQSRHEVGELLSNYITDNALRQFLLTNVECKEDKRFDWKMNMDGIIKNYSAISEAPKYLNAPFKCSTLFIKGADSAYISSEHRARIKRWFPLSRIHTVKNTGHWIHSEQPELFYSICYEYMTSERACLLANS